MDCVCRVFCLVLYHLHRSCYFRPVLKVPFQVSVAQTNASPAVTVCSPPPLNLASLFWLPNVLPRFLLVLLNWILVLHTEMRAIYCGFAKISFQFCLICKVIIFPLSYFFEWTCRRTWWYLSGGNINSSSFSLCGYCCICKIYVYCCNM